MAMASPVVPLHRQGDKTGTVDHPIGRTFWSVGRLSKSTITAAELILLKTDWFTGNKLTLLGLLVPIQMAL